MSAGNNRSVLGSALWVLVLLNVVTVLLPPEVRVLASRPAQAHETGDDHDTLSADLLDPLPEPSARSVEGDDSPGPLRWHEAFFKRSIGLDDEHLLNRLFGDETYHFGREPVSFDFRLESLAQSRERFLEELERFWYPPPAYIGYEVSLGYGPSGSFRRLD